MILDFVILRVAASLVPRGRRAEWLAEWNSELWYVREDKPAVATIFCLGAFQDAFWLRRNRLRLNPRRGFPLDSPLLCVSLLAAMAAVSAFFALQFHEPRNGSPPRFAYIAMLVIAILVLPATTSLSLGEYPGHRHWLRRWIFLVTKIVCAITIVFFGSLFLGASRPHGLLVGFVLGFRWALVDQRRRCPVCLRRLVNPARIGCSSQTFLEWYGTELMCAKGHGMMYVPEILTSYNTQRWLNLDPSWTCLF